MADDEDAELSAISAEYQRGCFLVGHFLSCWGNMESTLELAIWRLGAADGATGQVFTANMQLAQKAISFEALVRLRTTDTAPLSRAAHIVSTILELNTDRKNAAHCPFHVQNEQLVFSRTTTAKRELEWPKTSVAVHDWMAKCTRLTELDEQIFEVMRAVLGSPAE